MNPEKSCKKGGGLSLTLALQEDLKDFVSQISPLIMVYKKY